ncbi:ParA family protein [uncultured Chitinophaga sp.]|jgi:ATPases involved in chromosome partitioning|uniref:ParA family protein n=1 Tax=uncultured Chitinophaga sp. TaxID=339340 RepID=UPI00262B2942|nr:ParA family protein [uncultured Chitinophaga sp.]
MRIISVAIQKGGSGKTTTALNLAAALQQEGHRVLLADLDPQANLTQASGITDEPPQSIYELLKQAAEGASTLTRDTIITTGPVPVLPASLSLADAEMELVSIYGREHLLKQVLAPLQDDYDYIIIDCPPAMGMLTVNALAASSYVLIPMQAEFLPFKGVLSFMKHFQLIKKHVNKQLELLGLVLTKYDEHKSMHRQIRLQLEEIYNGKVLSTAIRNNIALAKAQQQGTSIFHLDKHCNGARDYLQLAREILKKFN